MAEVDEENAFCVCCRAFSNSSLVDSEVRRIRGAAEPVDNVVGALSVDDAVAAAAAVTIASLLMVRHADARRTELAVEAPSGGY